jgi:RNA polymerase sigma factor (sigma-70 family)
MPSVGVHGLRDPGHAELFKKWDKLIHLMVRKNMFRLSFWFDYDELLNHAREALWRAHKTFDPDDPSGANFQTYSRRIMVNEFNALHHYAKAKMRRDKIRSFSLDDEEVFLKSPHLPADLQIISDQDAAVVQAAIATLSDRERRIIMSVFGREKTLDDIGTELGVTRERIRQIKNKAVAKIARHVRLSTGP